MAGQSPDRVPPDRPPPPKVVVSSALTPKSVRHHFDHLKPLGKARVRWFYQEDKKWIPFNGSDSLRIESSFQALPESLHSPLLMPNEVDRSNIQLPTVRGGLYEVDILDRECRSIFWTETSVPIRRGTWFKGNISGSWEPVEEKLAVKIEDGHQQVVRSLGVGSPLNLSSANSHAMHEIKVGVNRIEWHDISEVFMVSESTGSRLAQKIGFSGGTELHRGYENECKDNDDLKEISHIVFLIHGMGQLYHADGGIVQSRKKFHDATEKANQKYFKYLHTDKGRIEFFPIEWRTKLKLDEGIIDTITPSNLGSLRKVINDTTLDVFYYTSPFYREEIMQAMRTELNSMFKSFCARNPSFLKNNGKVSIMAHSLGSVIIHDVLTLWNCHLMSKGQNADKNVAGVLEKSYSWHWSWGRPNEEINAIDVDSSKDDTEEELRNQLHDARLKVAKIENKIHGLNFRDKEFFNHLNEDCYSLNFRVENVFNIGSPLGVFLIMRGIRPREDVEQHILPTSVCKRTFNIYDPADPVAYRLEPLIYEHYANIPPLRLSCVRNLSCLSDSAINVPPQSGGGWLRSLFGSKLPSTSMHTEVESVEFTKYSQERIDLPKTSYETTEDLIAGKKALNPRIDYVLETSMVEYFSAITSHQSYWHNQDLAKFVINVIHDEDFRH